MSRHGEQLRHQGKGPAVANAGSGPMRIVISGSHGLIGSALLPGLEARGHRVIRLVRGAAPPASEDISWDPGAGRIDAERLEGMDAVIHLAGASIAAGRWTAAQKARIRQSRVDGTLLLARTLAARARRPGVLLSASAVGYYGDRGSELLDERSGPGRGFLADLCRDWEAATDPARAAGIRVVVLRTGSVVSSHGGFLARLLPVFRLGVGGPLGSGRQYLSWIALPDVVGAVAHLLAREDVVGPVNLVAPHPVTNREFTRTLARLLRRPAVAGPLRGDGRRGPARQRPGRAGQAPCVRVCVSVPGPGRCAARRARLNGTVDDAGSSRSPAPRSTGHGGGGRQAAGAGHGGGGPARREAGAGVGGDPDPLRPQNRRGVHGARRSCHQVRRGDRVRHGPNPAGPARARPQPAQ